jgi:hypothetical protein
VTRVTDFCAERLSLSKTRKDLSQGMEEMLSTPGSPRQRAYVEIGPAWPIAKRVDCTIATRFCAQICYSSRSPCHGSHGNPPARHTEFSLGTDAGYSAPPQRSARAAFLDAALAVDARLKLPKPPCELPLQGARATGL